MARPKKVGMGYFPLDCQMDDKIDILKAVHGIEGFAIYIMLLQEIYQIADGELDMTVVFRWKTLEKKFGIQQDNLRQIVADMLEIGLFDKVHFGATQKLTSNGIKKRIEDVEERRNKDRKRKVSAISPISESIPVENPNSPAENIRKSAQKEREKENKEINKEAKSYTLQILTKTDYWSVLQIPFSKYKSWLKSESKKVYVNFPQHWTKDMTDAYQREWLPYRQKKKNKLLPESIQAQIDQLSTLTGPQLIACLKSSIAGGYQGLFPDNFTKQDWAQPIQSTVPISSTNRPFREFV